ncbi:response regulator transcription factor [Ktedonosporobacter rubrisoli]|uniref:Response regulator transcription factor n=1 Tax=Ktedonosporobacter rubrisoli TaxID=2509675 RepID=A0A4P6JSC8_KTERU|nr:response regulator transcription factor [Ktedonosporobacter rubrisoli]QBD78417.1 response regulator transcription factor [Ktedonosporobacter rubrisoli]
MVKILVVDDHLLMRRAVREVIEKEGDLSVVAEAGNGLEAETRAAETQPDVVLMDLDMPDCNGFEATERVLACSPGSRVVIFTASHEEQHVFQAIQRGAIGYITKDIEPEALVHAIRCAARNDLCIPGSLATQVLAHLRAIWQAHGPFSTAGSFASAGSIAYRTPRRSGRRAVTAALSAEQLCTSPGLPTNTKRPLTGREQEILDLMRRGRKNREIAGELCIAESTVHKHVQNIFEKLHARNRTEAIYLTNPDN